MTGRLPSFRRAIRAIGALVGRDADARWMTATFAGLFGLVATIVLVWELDATAPPPPWLPLAWTPDQGLAAGAALLCAGVLGYALARQRGWTRRRWLDRAARAVVTGAVLFTGLTYLHGTRANAGIYHRRGDVYHYLLGAKYFEELGYDALYDCTLLSVPVKAIPDGSAVRDLRTYQLLSAGDVRRARAACRDRFSEPRWREFEADLTLWHEGPRADLAALRRVVTDHGYNGTPLHALLAGGLAQAFPVTDRAATVAALIDVFLICGGLLVVARTFGWKLGFVFAVFYFTDVVDRWGIIGGSYLRYSWLFTLLAGLAALKAERWATAAALLTASALLNVFPAVFLVGVAVWAVWTCVCAHAWTRPARRLAGGALAAGIFLGGIGALHGDGVANYGEFAEKMRVHTDDVVDEQGRTILRQSGFGVGLKYTFLYRGDHWADDIAHDQYPRLKKTSEYEHVREIHWAMGGLLVAVALVLGTRLDPVAASALAGFTIMFCFLDTAAYYFTVACVLILLWHEQVRDGPGVLMLTVWLSCSVLGYVYLLHENAHRVVLFNTVVTYTWFAALVATLAFLAARTGLFAAIARPFGPSAPR